MGSTKCMISNKLIHISATPFQGSNLKMSKFLREQIQKWEILGASLVNKFWA